MAAAQWDTKMGEDGKTYICTIPRIEVNTRFTFKPTSWRHSNRTALIVKEKLEKMVMVKSSSSNPLYKF
jgi:hypothetical protein